MKSLENWIQVSLRGPES